MRRPGCSLGAAFLCHKFLGDECLFNKEESVVKQKNCLGIPAWMGSMQNSSPWIQGNPVKWLIPQEKATFIQLTKGTITRILF